MLWVAIHGIGVSILSYNYLSQHSHSAQAQLAYYLTSISAAMSRRAPEHEALIVEYSHLRQLPREKEALHSLKKIASLVKPIMRARNWKVGTLAEFFPDQQNLLGREYYGILHSSYPG